MRDHYFKIILPNIDEYDLTAKQKQMLKSVAVGSSEECNGMVFIFVIRFLLLTYRNYCVYVLDISDS